jgi:DNA (cytosine-5)-methyltransferase 1
LLILDYLEANPTKATNLLRLLLFEAINNKKSSVVKIEPLSNPEKITILLIIESLVEHFEFNYHIHGGSKLPVLAFYSIYQCLINEISRYANCILAKLGSHTASDKTSKSSGDIEILKDGKLFESVEIKLDKIVDSHIVRVAIEKIYKFNPARYYILTNAPPIKDVKEQNEIDSEIEKTRNEHGCQIIINGVIPTLKYYLRLLEEPNLFIENYSNLVESDTEIKTIHKQKWNEIIAKNFN